MFKSLFLATAAIFKINERRGEAIDRSCLSYFFLGIRGKRVKENTTFGLLL